MAIIDYAEHEGVVLRVIGPRGFEASENYCLAA